MPTLDLFNPDDDSQSGLPPALLPLSMSVRRMRPGGNFEVGDGSVLPKARLAASSVPSEPVEQKAALPQANQANLTSLTGGYDTQIANYQKQLADLNKDPDYGPLQQQARLRGQQGMSMMAAAIAAGMGPQDMHGLQQGLASQAESLTGPMKIEGGQIDAAGNVQLDPGYKRQKQIETLRDDINNIEKLKQSAISADERLRAEQIQRQMMNQFHALQLQQNAENAAARREYQQGMLELRRDALDAKSGPMSPKDQYQVEDRMGDDFRNETKNYAQELDASRKILNLPTDRRWSPIEQQSAIIMLNKIQDPGSVVREGEFNRVAQAQGVFDRAKLLAARLTSGETLSPKLMADIRDVAKFYSDSTNKRMTDIAGNYTERAARRGLDARNVVGIWAPQPAPQPAAGTATGAPPIPAGNVNARKASYMQP